MNASSTHCHILMKLIKINRNAVEQLVRMYSVGKNGHRLAGLSDTKSTGIKYCPKITAGEKYRQYLRRHSKSITDTIGYNTNTAILTSLS